MAPVSLRTARSGASRGLVTGDVRRAGGVAGLAAALEELLTLRASEKAALGERARARVAEHFEIGKVVQQYEDFYEG